MVTVDPAKCTCFHDSFRAAADNIFKGLSTSRSAAADGYWRKWAILYREVSFNPLLVLYRYPVPIISAFARQYRTWGITPSVHQVKSHTVEDAVRSILQVLAALGTRYPRLTIQGELEISLPFQFWCYIKQYPLPI